MFLNKKRLADAQHLIRSTEAASCSQMFLKIGCSEKFCNIHKKAPVLESSFNTIVKGNSSTGVSCKYWETSANDCFWKFMKVFFDHEILLFWTCYEKGISCAFRGRIHTQLATRNVNLMFLFHTHPVTLETSSVAMKITSFIGTRKHWR